MSASLRLLRTATGIELVTLIVLLANLATVHWPVVSSVIGPTHGCAYLFVIIAAVGAAGVTKQATLMALIPGIGGLLALRRLTTQRRQQLSTGNRHRERGASGDDGRAAGRYTECLAQPDKGVNGFDSGR
ncbi:MAG: hypothetical protein ACRDUV_10020 [Pseudonocardiaceae bacterium]